MNQKDFANIIIIGIAILLGVAGYFILIKQPSPNKKTITTITPTPSPETLITKETIPPNGTKSVIKIPSSPAKLNTAGAPAEPIDQALAEITVLSQTEDGWKLHIDKIRDYIRYPTATNPQLKADDTISIHFNGWLDTFQNSEKICPAGYVKSPKPVQAEPTNQLQPPATHPQPKITIGDKYLSRLFGCFIIIDGFDCGPAGKGWSGGFYNPYPVIIEYECVKTEPNITPPSVETQQ